MGTNSAGQVGGGNEGQTDMGRGSKMEFSYSKSGRKTGRIGGGGRSSANTVEPDSNKRSVSDPRLA